MTTTSIPPVRPQATSAEIPAVPLTTEGYSVLHQMMRIRWSARRAEASDGTGGDGGAWLDGDAARALACDATITPIVTGDVNPGVLDDLVSLCLQLAGHAPRCHEIHPIPLIVERRSELLHCSANPVDKHVDHG